MLIKSLNTLSRNINLLPDRGTYAKRVMVVNGQVQEGFEDAVTAILAKTGYALTPELRQGKPYFAPPLAATAIPKAKPAIVKKSAEEPIIILAGDDTQPETYITIDQLRQVEEVLNDSYEEDARRYDRPDTEILRGRRAA